VVRIDVLQINYLENTFKPSDVLWDIGSHAGHYAFFAASIVKEENQFFFRTRLIGQTITNSDDSVKQVFQ
jgi:hypothetical protein